MTNSFKIYDTYCTCCKKRFEDFITFEPNLHLNDPEGYNRYAHDVFCPYCASAPRHRIMCLIFEEHPFDFSSTLLFAPNSGLKLWLGNNNINYKTADLLDSKADLQIDIQETELPSDSFTFISCDHMLEHIPSVEMALAELYRITAPGGVTVITVPIKPDTDESFEDATIVTAQQRRKEYGRANHIRRFGYDVYKEFETVGFDVTTYYGYNFPPSIVPKVGPSEYDSNRVYVCKKPAT